MSEYDENSYEDDYADDYSQDQGDDEPSGRSQEGDPHHNDSKPSFEPSSEYTPAGTQDTQSDGDKQGDWLPTRGEDDVPVKKPVDEPEPSHRSASEYGDTESGYSRDAPASTVQYFAQTNGDDGKDDATEESGYTDDDYGTSSHDASEASRDTLDAAMREVAANAMPTLTEASQESAASPEPEPGSQLGGGSSLLSGDEPATEATAQRRSKPQLTLSPVRTDAAARPPKSSSGSQGGADFPTKPPRKPPVPRQPRRPNADGSASTSSVPEPPVPEEPAYVPDWRALAGISVHSTKSSHVSQGSQHSVRTPGTVAPEPSSRSDARPATQESGRRRKKATSRAREDPFSKVRELEERMRFLQWRKKENETRLRQVMTSVRAQQASDAHECLATRREDATERLMWAAAIIQDELDKPLEVDKAFLLQFQEKDAKMREQWLRQAEAQRKLVRTAKERVLARVSTAPATSPIAAEPDAFPRPSTSAGHSRNSSNPPGLSHTSPGRLINGFASSRRGSGQQLALPAIEGQDGGSTRRVTSRPGTSSGLDELARLAELEASIKSGTKTIRATTVSAAVLQQFLKQ